MSHERLILTPILKEKGVQIVEVLSESHWRSWCVVTMKRFRELWGGEFEGSAILSHLSAQGKARYLSLPNRGDLLEGVKVSISASSVPSVSSLDRDVLHLNWTRERLEQQLAVIDLHCETQPFHAGSCSSHLPPSVTMSALLSTKVTPGHHAGDFHPPDDHHWKLSSPKNYQGGSSAELATLARITAKLALIELIILKKSALACLHSGNKKVALRHARDLKLGNESREKCGTFLNRVVEVLDFIANAEMTKKISEAIQIGAKAIKENRISVEEVEDSLQQIEESTDTLKQLENVIELTPLYSVTDDDEENIEEEFKKLELDIGRENHHEPIQKTKIDNAVEANISESAEASIRFFIKSQACG